jgi:hypothetical protein
MFSWVLLVEVRVEGARIADGYSRAVTTRLAIALAKMCHRESLTFGDSKVRNRLPPIHRHPPPTFNTTAAEINNELVGIATESS